MSADHPEERKKKGYFGSLSMAGDVVNASLTALILYLFAIRLGLI